MSDEHSLSIPDAETQVALLFERTGHEVREMVGHEPGTVVRFAQPQRGLVRPRTVWEVWLEHPASLEDELARLEVLRVYYQAERALGIVFQGSLPPGHDANLHERPVTAITWRTLVFELCGIADELRDLASVHEVDPGHPESFVPRQLQLPDGRVVDAVEHLESWIQSGEPGAMIIEGAEHSGCSTLLRHLAIRAACDYRTNPDAATPLVADRAYRPVLDGIAFAPEWVVWLSHSIPRPMLAGRYLATVASPLIPAEPRHGSGEGVSLLEPRTEHVHGWYREHLQDTRRQLFIEAWKLRPAFVELARIPAHFSDILKALRESDDKRETPLAWLGDTVVRFLRGVTERLPPEMGDVLEQGAFEQFALGASRTLGDGPRYWERQGSIIDAWFERLPAKKSKYRYHLDEFRFKHVLIRDYFIARKIASEVRAGRREILTRYQFPEEYVLVFLAVMAPDVVAHVTADRSEEIHAQIRSEVEHQVQLTLAHQLRRSAGALRSNLKRILAGADISRQYEYEIRRVDEELDFLSALAEHTRKWHEVPEIEMEDLTLADVVHQALDPLREQFPRVSVAAQEVPRTLAVRASRDHLRESLHNLLENAFQAAVCVPGPDDQSRSPRVTVRASYQGKVVRIDVLDNGPGVAEGDRERIFEPRVTTKKGGEGMPMGTGMGLPIARRYTEAMGGRVQFDASAGETCFYIELIAGRARP